MFNSFGNTETRASYFPPTPAKPAPFFQAKSSVPAPVMRAYQENTPIKKQTSFIPASNQTIQAAHKCSHNNPCSAANRDKPYALHWGNDTVCTKFGFPDSNLELKNAKKGNAADCCNHKPSHVEDYAINQLSLDGAASCARANQKKIAEVTYNGNSVKVICADTYPSGTGCNQEIELSQNASAKLNGGTANNLCPIQVTYSTNETLSQHLCYAKKMKRCISDFCKTKQ